MLSGLHALRGPGPRTRQRRAPAAGRAGRHAVDMHAGGPAGCSLADRGSSTEATLSIVSESVGATMTFLPGIVRLWRRLIRLARQVPRRASGAIGTSPRL